VHIVRATHRVVGRLLQLAVVNSECIPVFLSTSAGTADHELRQMARLSLPFEQIFEVVSASGRLTGLNSVGIHSGDMQ
jgi:hypothetical protein